MPPFLKGRILVRTSRRLRSRISALTLLNIFRIAVLVRVAETEPALFDYLHEYVWQGLFLVLTVAYAMSWVERTR